MRGARFQRAEGVGDRAAGVVVAVELDVAVDLPPQPPHQVIDLAGTRDAHRVRHTHPVHADLVHRAVGTDQVVQIAAERVLRAEPDLDIVRPDVLDHLDRRLDHLFHALAVGVLPQVAGRAEHDVDPVDAGFERQPRVVQVATGVRQYLGPEPEAGHPFAVVPAAATRGRRGQLEVLDPERVQQARDLHLLVAVEEGVGELLTLAQGRLDDGWMGRHGGILRIQESRRTLELDGRPRKVAASISRR